MNKALAAGLGVIVIAVFFFPERISFFKNTKLVEETDTEEVSVTEVPSIGMTDEYEDYTKTFKTFESKYGFSFQYPPHLKLIEDPEPFITQRIYLTSTKYDGGAIVISVEKNIDGLSVLEFLKENKPESFKKGEYSQFLIDGQKAVSPNNEDWIMVNTPDNKYTISISLLAGKDVIMFTEWGIVQESFKFLR